MPNLNATDASASSAIEKTWAPFNKGSTIWLRIKNATPFERLVFITLFFCIATALFLTWNVKASWEFTLNFRSKKLFTLILVGASISVATVLFQTISNNRILTPNIMGFDSLYIFLQAILVLTLGIIGFSTMNTYFKWGLEVLLMMGSMILLYQALFSKMNHSLHLLILAGIIMGVLFSSLSALVFRMLDPTAFTVLQDSLFASFGSVDPQLLKISWVVLALTLIFVSRFNRELDVMLLGQLTSTTLGVDYNKRTRQVLLIIALLISLSTALVGPISFFGLLVAHLTYRLCGDHRHRYVLSFSALLGMCTLVAGEFILQHLLSFNTRLSIIIEFIGGLFFLSLIIRQSKL